MFLPDHHLYLIERAVPGDEVAMAEINRLSLINDCLDREGRYTSESWIEHTSRDNWVEVKQAIYRDEIESDDRVVVVAREIDATCTALVSKIGAYAVAEIGPDLKSTANYTSLYIDSGHRYRHLAALLTLRVMQAALEADNTTMRLWAVDFDKAAISVHEKFGFKPTGGIKADETVAGSPQGMSFIDLATGDLSKASNDLQKRLLEEKRLRIEVPESSFEPMWFNSFAKDPKHIRT